jgi:CHAD domain-containing protein
MQTIRLAREAPTTARPNGPGRLARLPVRRVEAQRVVLPGASVGEAFEVIVASCVDRFRRSEEQLARTGDADTLHQARVALRQLRSAFSIFAPALSDERFEQMRGELRWLAAATNEARDLDVLIGLVDAPPSSLTDARECAYARATKALASARARDLMLELGRSLDDGVWRQGPGAARLPAAEFAFAALDRLRRKVKKKGRHLRNLDDAELHELRIAAKKLRYASEFFVGLYSSPRAHKREERFVQALRALQDRLGELQDAAVAPALLERLQVPPANWPKRPGRKRLIGRADGQYKRVFETAPFWR